MDAALDRPTPAALLTQWTLQPLAVLAILALAVAYVHGVRQVDAPWSRSRSATFAVGLLLLLWTTCGFPGVYASSLFWVWTAQLLAVWLVIPIVLLFGHPLQLARAVTGPHGRLQRVLRSRPVRIVANPLVGPALVPILSFAVFFGPVPGLAVGTPIVGWTLQLLLVLVGAAMVLPLVGLDDDSTSSLAVGLGLAIGSFELVIDALPGILMRLSDSLVSSYFDARSVHPWSPHALSDQRLAGGTLWCIAELIDLPFLVLVFRRWLRVDAKDAAVVDAVLEAERAARGVETDEPWWLSDPAIQRRLRREE